MRLTEEKTHDLDSPLLHTSSMVRQAAVDGRVRTDDDGYKMSSGSQLSISSIREVHHKRRPWMREVRRFIENKQAW